MKLYRKVIHEKNTVRINKKELEEILKEYMIRFLNKEDRQLTNIEFEYCFEESYNDYEDVILQEILITSNDIQEEFIDTPNQGENVNK